MTEIRTRDFSRAPRELEFTADGETYKCFSAVPPVTLQEMLTLSNERMEKDYGTIAEFFDLCTAPDVASRIRARLTPGVENPIDLYQAIDIAIWLIQEYAQRPLKSSVSSTDGSRTDSDGKSSTDGALIEDLIL